MDNPYRFARIRIPAAPEQVRSTWIRLALLGILGLNVITSGGDSNPRSALNRILQLPVDHPTRLNATHEYVAQGFDHVRNQRENLGVDAFIIANELHPSAEMEYNVVFLLTKSLGYQQPPLDPTVKPDWIDIPLLELRSDPEYMQALNSYTAESTTINTTNRLTTLRLVTLPLDQRLIALRKLRAAQQHLRSSIDRQKQLLVSMEIATAAENVTRDTNCEAAAERDNDDLIRCRGNLMFLRQSEALLPVVDEAVTAIAITLE